jgi:hypothetical protein
MQIGVVGRITAGKEQGSFVRVEDDTQNTGGFLILIAADADFLEGGSDYWVEDRDSLEQFARESDWVVEWKDPTGLLKGDEVPSE